MKSGTSQHAVCVACRLHKKCSRIVLIRKLPFGATPLIVKYLEAGLRYPSREDGHKHVAMCLVKQFVVSLKLGIVHFRCKHLWHSAMTL